MLHVQQIGDIIRYHRKRAGLSRVALADLAGVGKTLIFDLEHGKETIRLGLALRVLETLNITLALESPLMAAYKEVRDEKS